MADSIVYCPTCDSVAVVADVAHVQTAPISSGQRSTCGKCGELNADQVDILPVVDRLIRQLAAPEITDQGVLEFADHLQFICASNLSLEDAATMLAEVGPRWSPYLRSLPTDRSEYRAAAKVLCEAAYGLTLLKSLSEPGTTLEQEDVEELTRLSARNVADTDAEDGGAFTEEIPYVRESPKVGRNAPCPCGSGKKYKKCCAGAI